MTHPDDPEPAGAEAAHDHNATADPFAGEEWPAERETDVEPGTTPQQLRRRRVSRRRLRRRRRLGLVLLIPGGLVVLTLLWMVVTGLLARHELTELRGGITTLDTQIYTGDLPAARSTARALSAHAERAHELTTGPFWAGAAALPGDGNPARTLRAMTTQIHKLGSSVLPRLVAASTQLDPGSLRLPNGAVDLARITAATPTLDGAVRTVNAATARVAAQPSSTWFGVVDSSRRQLLTEMRHLGGTVRSADLAAHIAPPLLGQDGVRRYFVAFQNDAEARGTGGIPGAFAIMRADHGKLTFERFEPDNRLYQVPTGLNFGAQYAQLFQGAETTSLYSNTNISPHFPYAAQIWIAMWRKASGETLNGAFAIDPTALSYLLRVTGPAPLADGQEVTYRNVVALTQSTVYAEYPAPTDQAARKQYLLSLARSVSHKLLDSTTHLTGLVRAAGRAAGERRILAYSTDPQVEADLAQTAIGGTVPDTAAPYVGLAVVNDGGNKLDYYLHRSITWRANGCAAQRPASATITLHNSAPASGLSSYVTARNDHPGYRTNPGDNRLLVYYYATRGALLRSITVDGKAYTATSAQNLGHAVFVVDLELPRGQTRTVVLHLLEPRGTGSPQVLRQPGVNPLQVNVQAPDCG